MNYLKIIVFLLYVFVGFYFINLPLELYSLPETISEYHNTLLFLGGVLILIGGVSILMVLRRKKKIFQ